PTHDTVTSARVLLVEDHPDTRLVLTMVLKRLGCTVTAAGTVADAIAAGERQQFDLLISDIGLPDGSGIDIMKRLKNHDLRGIAISGFGQDEDLRRSQEAGFEMHLTKPVNYGVLRDTLVKLTS